MQFQFNSDYPDEGIARDPSEFPPADPSPCARLTTRVYHPSRQVVSTVQNVLVKTLQPPRRASLLERSGIVDMNDDSSSSSSSSSYSSSSSDDDDESMESVEPEIPNNNVRNSTDTTGEPPQVETAYWMQRTIREAIYGRVLFAVVLKKRPNIQGAEWEVTTQKCAIKEMSWQHIRRERNKLAEDPIQEVSAMQFLKQWWDAASATSDAYTALQKTNIMMPMDLLSDDRYLYSIMPFCDGGELFDRLDMNEKFSEDEARYWMHQVLNGIENLQHAGVCHRDMSLENLLVHQNGVLIIDLGMCLRVPYKDDPEINNVLTNSMMNMTLSTSGTMNGDIAFTKQRDGRTRPRCLMNPQGTCGKWIYMSPEIYQNKVPFDGFAVDMWAAGVILFLMLTGFPPWEQAVATDERFKYMTAGYLVQMLTEWELGLSSDAMDLLQRMLWLDPKDRLSLDQVRAHPWMAKGVASQNVQSQGTIML